MLTGYMQNMGLHDTVLFESLEALAEDGVVTKSQAYIAAYSNMSLRTVNSKIRDWERIGILKREKTSAALPDHIYITGKLSGK